MHELTLINTVAAAFTAAWIFGLITTRMRLSPIVGYLLAGIAIGPFTPGLVADTAIAQQLAELGVILLMFGVGLHFDLSDLMAVRRVAVPGAIGQSFIATLLGAGLALAYDWPLESGLVLGMAMAVASTVVLIRVLSDNHKLDTEEGHVAVGWLIVEDILTVVVLVLIPAMGSLPEATPADTHAAVATTQMVAHDGQVATTAGATDQVEAAASAPAAHAAAEAPASAGDHAPASAHAPEPPQSLWIALPLALIKLAIMIVVVLFLGSKLIPKIMVRVARLRSRELFTLTVLVVAIAVAAGAYYTFGASMALGAFLAGMVVGQSPVSQQAAADALPLRDAFSVLFFASVGMLFNPMFIVDAPVMFLAGLSIVMIGKPLAALVIVAIVGHSGRTALTVAFALAQIGEFSFILSSLGNQYQLIGDMGHNLLVACAIVSITLNPMLFRLIGPTERLLQRWPTVWGFLNRRAHKRTAHMNERAGELLEQKDAPVAVIVGYGPVGRTVDDILRGREIETVIVDLNMDTIQQLTREGRGAIYGDAYNVEVMHQALARATHLIITLPHSVNRTPVIVAAKLINPDIKIFVRARHLLEREELQQAGADAFIFEEAEAAVALARMVLFDQGEDEPTIRRESIRIRQQLATLDGHHH
jgi:CPA2 family monovalent cation:H+ antiporter-2